MLVRYENVRDLFAGILNNWVMATTSTKLARNIVLATERRPSAFMELRFLPLVHAAEVLTDGKYSTIVERSEFEKVKNEMLQHCPNDLPPELAESIKNSLGWANGRNSKSKLKKMLGQYQEATCHLFCISTETFINGVVDARNYYTHYSAKKRLLQNVELHWAIEKLSLMLRMLLLLKAGVPEDVLQRLVHCHHRLRGDRAVWSTITEEGSPFGGGDGD